MNERVTDLVSKLERTENVQKELKNELEGIKEQVQANFEFIAKHRG